jgi:hypothetical protein
MKSRFGSLCFVLAAGFVMSLASARSARAVVLAYEPFDYAAGSTITTGAGGTGFSAAWQANSTNANNFISVAGSFAYADSGGRQLTTTGNRAWVTGDGSATGDNLGGNTSSAQ